jgi:PAS domain S-box-containing protein
MEQHPSPHDALHAAEARLALVAAVSELIGAFDDPADLLYEVSRALGEHLQARRCLFTEIDLEHDRGVVRRDYCRGASSVAGVYKISDYSELTIGEMQAGRIVVNRDSSTDPRTAADYERAYAPHGERAYVALPLLRDGRWVAELWVSDDVPRDWREQDVALLASVAERVWTAVEKLRVHAALRESEARMQFVGERAGVGYWYWDIVRDELLWSPACKRLFGMSEDADVTYASFLTMLHPEDRDRTDRIVRASLAGEGAGDYDIEYRAVWPDGTIRWIHARGSATFENGAAVRMAGITMDITQRKALEREREELLQRERRLRAAADEASLAKDHFLALLSHELRTPMTTILGWAAFLGSGMADPATVHKGIESIEQSSRIQARLIDDLLDVSRIVTGKLSLENALFDVTETVRTAVEGILPAAHADAIDVAADLGRGPAFLFGDATRMQQVISNLLSNAVKFTPSHGRVSVTVRELDDAVEIRVSDTGVGIEPDFLPHVFERFRQADDGPSRQFGGLGLGLSIVRNLTELHGGTVQATSEGTGRGAEFTVRLPRAVVAAEAAPVRDADTPVAADALAGLHVLVVDDDTGARDVIATMLAGFGAHVTQSPSTRDAMLSLALLKPDVVVSDIGMPGEDGYALIRCLRTSATEAARVPAIAVTAYADPQDRDRVLGAGYQAHLAKPIEPGVLAAAVLRVLQ